jgi:microcin C transport system substrate-binding protein
MPKEEDVSATKVIIRRLVPVLLVALILGAVAAGSPALAQEEATPAHALAMHGDLKYPAEFTNLNYVNPDAPKGGEITLHASGTFNSFNPYILEGDAYDTSFGGERRFTESLLEATADEPFSEYCLLCETVTMPADRSWVEFKLRPEAKWSDGTPVTVDDVYFSWETLRSDKAHPFYQDYWKSLVEAVKVDDQTIRFNFDPAEKQNRELPLIAGQMPVLQKAWWSTREFNVPSVDVPVSSGPYKIEAVEPGTSFTFVRDPNYWGKDLPINKGRFNFDKVKIDYYRDETVALEAFKAGEYDFRYENSSKNWGTAYEFPAITEGLVTKELIPNSSVQGMQGFVFNQRKDLFKDPLVREAIGYAFDFEWSNANLFYDQYTRTKSYWDNSELTNPGGVPQGKEAKYLEPWKNVLPPEVYTTTYIPPSTGGTEEGLRANLEVATKILEEAGWTVNDQEQLVNKDGEPFKFEIVLDSPTWERITQPFIDNLKRLGIEATMRQVDPAQYETLVEAFDYDMIVYNRGMSPSPGNEQRNYWTCESAKTTGSQNYYGVCNEAIDALVDNVIQASSREDLVQATHALDRALLWNYLVVPHWHITADRVAYWNVISRPETSPAYGIDFNTWFFNETNAELIRQQQAAAASEFANAQATVDAAATLGITPPTPLPQATVAPTEVVTETAETAPETGEGGGMSGGTIAIIVAVVIALGAVVLFMRRGKGEQ